MQQQSKVFQLQESWQLNYFYTLAAADVNYQGLTHIHGHGTRQSDGASLFFILASA